VLQIGIKSVGVQKLLRKPGHYLVRQLIYGAALAAHKVVVVTFL
jgi:hypothetical protein